jgi:hypothetical protein
MLIERKHRFFPEETRDPPINEDDESMQAHDLCRDGGRICHFTPFFIFARFFLTKTTGRRRRRRRRLAAAARKETS